MLLEMITLAHTKYRLDCALQMQVVIFNTSAHMGSTDRAVKVVCIPEIPQASQAEKRTPGSQWTKQEQYGGAWTSKEQGILQ